MVFLFLSFSPRALGLTMLSTPFVAVLHLLYLLSSASPTLGHEVQGSRTILVPRKNVKGPEGVVRADLILAQTRRVRS